MLISMESAEMDLDDVKDDVLLSEDDRIKGLLHIEEIKAISENGKAYLDYLKMKREDAEILHFEFQKNRVKFDIMWSSFPPHSNTEDFSTIEIQADKIWWENNPDLKI
jgi:hypothetical protein